MCVCVCMARPTHISCVDECSGRLLFYLLLLLLRLVLFLLLQYNKLPCSWSLSIENYRIPPYFSLFSFQSRELSYPVLSIDLT